MIDIEIARRLLLLAWAPRAAAPATPRSIDGRVHHAAGHCCWALLPRLVPCLPLALIRSTLRGRAMVRQIAHPGAVSPPVSPAGRGKTEPEPKPEPEPENSSNVQEGRAEPAGSPEERPTSAMSARELVKWAEQLSSRSPTGRLASALKEAAESPPKEYGNTEERLEALG